MLRPNLRQRLSGSKVLLIDNRGQWTYLEERMLKELGASVLVVPNTRLPELERFDAVVLSGGSPRISLDELGRVPELVDRCAELEKPLLGICVGHQYLAVHFGGGAEPAEVPEFGPVELRLLDRGHIFSGLPERFRVWESHNDEVKHPGRLLPMASSDTCRYQALRHPELPIYGVQFHPEVNEAQFGREIFTNFLLSGGREGRFI